MTPRTREWNLPTRESLLLTREWWWDSRGCWLPTCEAFLLTREWEFQTCESLVHSPEYRMFLCGFSLHSLVLMGITRVGRGDKGVDPENPWVGLPDPSNRSMGPVPAASGRGRKQADHDNLVYPIP